MEPAKSTGGVIGIIVVLIVIVVGGIFFWGDRVSPAREKAAQEKMRAEQEAKINADTDVSDEVTGDIDALGNIDLDLDLPDLN